MGIYDRDYYRREGPSFLGTFTSQGQVCKWLIITNVIAYVIQLVTKHRLGFGDVGPFTELFELVPEAVFRGEIWRLLTYSFLHSPEGFPWHIIWNMVFLWWFGHELEERYGRWEFLAFYLLSALLGGICYTLVWKFGIGPSAPCIGASGAVTAVMVLYAFINPYRIILVFFLPLPIWALVGFQVLQDTLGFISGVDNGVAVTVHLAGAAFGALYYQTDLHLLGMLPKFSFGQRQRTRPRLRVYREDETETPQPVPVAAPPAGDVDEQLEAKLDAILEKVARSGQGSLTDSERQILLRASEIYKKRRS